MLLASSILKMQIFALEGNKDPSLCNTFRFHASHESLPIVHHLAFHRGKQSCTKILKKQQPSDICCIKKKPLLLFITKAQIFLIVLFFSTAVTIQLYPISFLALSTSKSAYLSAHNLTGACLVWKQAKPLSLIR